MQNIIRYIPVLTVLLSVFMSCTGRKSLDDNIDNAVKIDVTVGKSNEEFVDLIDNVRFIPLETGSDAPVIGEVSKIIYYDSCYYVLDREQTTGLYRYDVQGRFLNLIGHKGRGPGEYIEPSDFIVNSSGIIILDHFAKKLLFYGYEGDYKRAVSLNYIVYEITGMQDENFIFAIAGNNKYSKEAKNYEILILDIEGKFISAGIYNKYEMNFSSPYSSHLYDGKVRYSKALRSKIYGVDMNGVSVDYYLDILNSPLPSDYEEECGGDYEMFIENYKGRYNYFAGKFLENDDVVFFTTLDKKRMVRWNIYRKNTGQVYSGSYPSRDQNRISPEDMILLSGINGYLGCYDNDIVGYLNAPALAIKEFALKYPVLEGLQTYDNPVVFRFEFKTK